VCDDAAGDLGQHEREAKASADEQLTLRGEH